MHLKAILIDIDDTLLDFRANAHLAMERAFSQFGLPFSEERFHLFEVRNLALWKRLERKELTKEELFRIRWKSILAEMQLNADAGAMEDAFRTELHRSAIPVDGARELLDYLSGRYRLFAASNGMFAQQQERLGLAGMLPYFEALFVSESVGAEKPSAAFFDACFLRMDGVAPSESLMIGDSVTADIQGAVAYGIPCIWFDRYQTMADPPGGVICSVHSLSEIKKII